jgi:hypothetical protein
MRHGQPTRPAYLFSALVVVLVAIVAAIIWFAVDRPATVTGHATPPPATAALRAEQAAPVPSVSTSPGLSPSASGSHPTNARTVTLVNQLSQTVWAAATKDSKHPLSATGWVLAPGARVDVSVPNQWSGRFWGRTGCSFDGSGKGHCQTGDCAGGYQCTGSGATPATLAEWSFGAWNGLDFYDVSLVDGANLPMWINIVRGTTKDPVSASGCVAAGCTKAVDCPAAMQVSKGGAVVACETACAAFGTDDYCCRGAWSGRTNCVPAKWPVDYTQVFKKAEPYAYSYAYDDSATMSCRGNCDYRITFGVSPS